jgi:hypothetical protein
MATTQGTRFDAAGTPAQAVIVSVRGVYQMTATQDARWAVGYGPSSTSPTLPADVVHTVWLAAKDEVWCSAAAATAGVFSVWLLWPDEEL